MANQILSGTFLAILLFLILAGAGKGSGSAVVTIGKSISSVFTGAVAALQGR